MNTPPFEFRRKALVVGGKPRLTLSGEVQYFRTDRKIWGKVIKRLKEAHCDTLSTYIPWSWHEIGDGEFDFTGRTHPCRDLAGFLDMAASAGFRLVLKPGPYVFAELKNGGIPAWLIEKHPEAIALGPDGKTRAQLLKFPFMSYLHPAYMSHGKRWLDEVYQVLEPYSNRTILWQVDNEINYGHSFFWYGPYSLDYNPFLVKRGIYQAWLHREYGTIGKLNSRYRTRWRTFDNAVPPVKYSPAPGDVCRSMDWVGFKEWIAVENVRQFCDYLHGLGVAGPFCVNAPFTAWPTAWANTKRWMKNQDYEVVIAHVDYPGMINDSNIGETLGLIHYARGCDNAIETNLETQACTVSKIWGKHGASYDLTHKSLVGAGMNVVNYYWFNDGINFEGSGHYQVSHEYNCPLDVRGNPKPHYFGIKHVNSFLKAHPEIASTTPRAEVEVANTHEWGRGFFSTARWDGSLDNKANAVLNLLGGCGVTFDTLDLRDWDTAKRKPRTLFVQPPRFMPRYAMEKLVKYARSGGHLIISNYLPLEDENLRPCRKLAAALGASSTGVIPAKSGGLEPNKIQVVGKEIFVLDRLQWFKRPAGSKVFATCEGKTVGFRRRLGRGRVSVLGFKLEFLFTELHRAVLGALLGRKLSSGPLVLTRSGEGTVLKTVLNVHDEPDDAMVDGKRIHLPGKTAAFVLKKKGRRTIFI